MKTCGRGGGVEYNKQSLSVEGCLRIPKYTTDTTTFTSPLYCTSLVLANTSCHGTVAAWQIYHIRMDVAAWQRPQCRIHPCGVVSSAACLGNLSVWQTAGYAIPANTTRWNNDVLLLGQRRRRWANIKTSLF